VKKWRREQQRLREIEEDRKRTTTTVRRDGASYQPLVEEPEETTIEYMTDEDWDLRPWWCRFGDIE
jgi:hypothetical protein